MLRKGEHLGKRMKICLRPFFLVELLFLQFISSLHICVDGFEVLLCQSLVIVASLSRSDKSRRMVTLGPSYASFATEKVKNEMKDKVIHVAVNGLNKKRN